MGRTGKLKKKSTSIHSRAARRDKSPSDVNKSLDSVPRAEATAKPSSVLAAHSNAGITKKKSKSKALSRAQRLRQQKSIERAESVIDQLESKVAKSVGKMKSISERKVKLPAVHLIWYSTKIYMVQAQWEDLNGKQKKTKSLQQAQESDDERMEESSKSLSTASAFSTKAAPPALAGNPLPSADYEAADDDDNIT